MKRDGWFHVTLIDRDSKGIVSGQSPTRCMKFRLDLLKEIGSIPWEWMKDNINGLKLRRDVKPIVAHLVGKYTLDEMTEILLDGVTRLYTSGTFRLYDETNGTHLKEMVIFDDAFRQNAGLIGDLVGHR